MCVYACVGVRVCVCVRAVKRDSTHIGGKEVIIIYIILRDYILSDGFFYGADTITMCVRNIVPVRKTR